MSKADSLIVREDIEDKIHFIRGRKVIFDRDLASLYGVSTSRLNEQVKRNRGRFPERYMFKITKEEREEVIANCDNLKKLKYYPTLPNVFTEHGVVMAASILNTKKALEVSVFVVDVFVDLRGFAASYKELSKRIDCLESKFTKQFKIVFDAIRKILDNPIKPKRRIGFGAREDEEEYK